MSPETEALATLRGDMIEVCTGTTFVIVGFVALAVAALRRRSGVRAIVWVGIWSTSYGVLSLVGTRLFVTTLPGWLRVATPYIRVAVTYLMLAIATMAWLQISRGKIRILLQAIIFVALVIALIGFV